MKPNDEHLLRVLLDAGPSGAPETHFPFATQKRLQEMGLIRYQPGSESALASLARTLVLTHAGRRAALFLQPSRQALSA
jgi:hypothetical protein